MLIEMIDESSLHIGEAASIAYEVICKSNVAIESQPTTSIVV